MGRGLSELQRRILAWVEAHPVESWYRDGGGRGPLVYKSNWRGHPDFGASPQAVSRALRRLEDRGLVKRGYAKYESHTYGAKLMQFFINGLSYVEMTEAGRHLLVKDGKGRHFNQ